MKLKRILEFTEFSAQRMSSDSNVRGATQQVNDPQLSLDSYDKFMTNSELINRRLSDIYVNVLASNINNSNQSSFDKLYSVITNIKNLTVLRIFFNDSVNATVYFSFLYENIEYFGQILNFNTKEPIFKCEFLYNISTFTDKEAHIKIKGIIIKAIKKWLAVEQGEYVALKGFLSVNIKSGEQCFFKEKTKINVTSSTDSVILFTYKNESYKISGKNYYFFNYYFDIVKK